MLNFYFYTFIFLYIYISISMLYFYIFSRLWFFKGLNQKAQENISKRAAVEKEPSTLEKDKEDRSKHYFSYPKLPVKDI